MANGTARTACGKARQFLAWLFNESPAAQIVVDDRWGQRCRHKHGGFYTTEFTPGMKDGRHPWEENRTMTRPRAYDAEGRPLWYDWVFNRQLTLENYYSARELVLTLVDTVSRGGNLLLNVGPTPGRPAAGNRRGAAQPDRRLAEGQWGGDFRHSPLGPTSCQWSAGERPPIDYNRRMAAEVRYRRHRRQAGRRPGRRRGIFHREGRYPLRDSAMVAVPRRGSQDVRPSKRTVATMLGSAGPLKWSSTEEGSPWRFRRCPSTSGPANMRTRSSWSTLRRACPSE